MSSGNSVWILTKFPDGLEYTIVYRQMSKKSNLACGAEIKAGSVLGEFSNEHGARLEVWRVSGPDQYFLRGGAKRVAPLAP